MSPPASTRLHDQLTYPRFPMPDQADKLRQLATNAAPPSDVQAGMPPTVVVSGGKGGVGATTVALNLAVALSHGGRRAVLVDAAPNADAAHLVGLDASAAASIADVVAGVCSADEALLAGPQGTWLLPGSWAADPSPDRSSRSCDRLLKQLRSVEDRADVLVIDSGCGATNWTRQLWQRARLVLLVSTPDDVAIMDSYAAIKRNLTKRERCPAPEIRVLVNQCDDDALAADAQRRIATACHRFLGRTIDRAPPLPCYCANVATVATPMPQAWEAPQSQFGRSVRQLGRFVSDVLSHGAPAAWSAVLPEKPDVARSWHPRETAVAVAREFSRC